MTYAHRPRGSGLALGLCVALLFCLGLPRAALAQEHRPGDVVREPGEIEHFGTTYKVDFGSLWVPMNRRQPDGRLLELRFVHYKSTARNPGPPVVYLAGGPGGSGIATMRFGRARAFLALLDQNDFIAFDQRGTGESEPRDLAVEVSMQLPLDEPGAPDRYCDTAREVARAALAMLEARGIDPRALTTEQSADDLDDLRRAVGADELVLWGSSYGTHLALAAARRHPGAVAALILAGTEGPDHTFKLPSNIDGNLERLAALVAEDPVYGEIMPDLVTAVEAVRRDLEADPRTITLLPGLEVTVGAWDLQKALSDPMGSRTGMQELPAAVYAMSHGEFFDLATAMVGERRVGGISAMSLVMDCASWATDARLERIRREADASVLGAAIDFPYPCLCEVEGMPRLGDDFRAPLKSDIPALFISGTLDGRTPVSNAREVAEGFAEHRHLVVRNASHGGDLFTSSPRIVELVKMFLRGETLPVEEIEGPAWEFEPPYTRSLQHEMLGILTTEGFDAAAARYGELRERFGGEHVYDFREQVLNNLGYGLLNFGRTDLAIEVFRLNTVAYPEAFNTWDSLAEGYLEAGDDEKAIRYYEKSLRLNPDNANAVRMLERIRSGAG